MGSEETLNNTRRNTPKFGVKFAMWRDILKTREKATLFGSSVFRV